MMVINQSNHYGSIEDSIWSEKLSDGSHPFLYITPDNPAKLIWSDDNGYVFIRFNGESYKVQSIDIDYVYEAQTEGVVKC